MRAPLANRLEDGFALGERREVRGEGERSSYSLRSRNLNKSYYSSTLIFIATAPLVGAQTTANYAIAESYLNIDAPEAREARVDS